MDVFGCSDMQSSQDPVRPVERKCPDVRVTIHKPIQFQFVHFCSFVVKSWSVHLCCTALDVDQVIEIGPRSETSIVRMTISCNCIAVVLGDVAASKIHQNSDNFDSVCD